MPCAVASQAVPKRHVSWHQLPSSSDLRQLSRCLGSHFGGFVVQTGGPRWVQGPFVALMKNEKLQDQAAEWTIRMMEDMAEDEVPEGVPALVVRVGMAMETELSLSTSFSIFAAASRYHVVEGLVLSLHAGQWSLYKGLLLWPSSSCVAGDKHTTDKSRAKTSSFSIHRHHNYGLQPHSAPDTRQPRPPHDRASAVRLDELRAGRTKELQ